MRPCESCKEPYSARPLSRFCSSPCRQWDYRNRVAAAARPTTAAPVPVVAPAVFAELLAAGQDRSVLGVVALELASRIDSVGGLGVAPLARELRAAMDAALGAAGGGGTDPLDELRARRSYILRRKP